jgi:hypothetical protein
MDRLPRLWATAVRRRRGLGASLVVGLVADAKGTTVSTDDPRMHTATWKALRLLVLDRDRWTCQVQDPGCTVVATQVDHIVPRVEGGAFWDPSNLRGSCPRCNLGRGGRLGNQRKGAAEFTYRTTLAPTETRF